MSKKVENFQERILRLQEKIAKVTSDPNRATRLYSPASYPINSSSDFMSDHIMYKTCSVKPSDNHEYDMHNSQESRKQLIGEPEVILEQFLGKEMDALMRGTLAQNPLNHVRSVSSLLVYRTYESRLVSRPSKPSAISVNSNQSSFHDYRSHRSKGFALTGDGTIKTNRSSNSGEDADTNLGPVPDSILKHHQESIIDTNFFDNMDILDRDEEDSNNLIGDLPDILPSLDRIVVDVSLVDRNQAESSSSTENLSDSNYNNLGRLSQQSSSTSSMSAQVQTNASEITQPIPPPPPPPPPMPQSPLHSIAALEPRAESALPPPPPPPPPAPLIEDKKLPAVASNVALNDRSALMAEIRSASSKPKPRTKVTKPVESNTTKLSETESVVGKENVLSQRSLIGQSNPRDSLLASIRDAAGKPKRKVGQAIKSRKLEEKIEQKKQNISKSDNSGGDLMSDLVNKLRSRRDGISGSFVSNKSNDENPSKQSTIDKIPAIPADTLQQRVLTKVSSMIPERRSSSSSSSGEEGLDQFNDDDWN